MGCYMSKPDNRVYITEGRGKNFEYATASCQGWRREQEDAEACLPYYDENSSLFMLCDGHGGAEVAKYTVQHFPDFLKNHQLYKEGKFEEALERALMEFDSLLRSDEVMTELHRMAYDDEQQGKEKMLSDQMDNDDDVQKKDSQEEVKPAKSSSIEPAASSSGSSSKIESLDPGPSSSKGPTSVVDDVDTETLRKEAEIPLRQLLEQYATTGIDPAKRSGLLAKYNSSPVIKTKPEDGGDDDADQADTSRVSAQSGEPTSSPPGDENPEAITKETIKGSLIRQVLQHYFDKGDAEDSSDDSEYNADDSSNDDGDDEGDGDLAAISSKKQRKRKHKHMADQNTSSEEDEEEDDEEDEDEDEEDEEDEEEEEEDEEETEDSDQDLDEDLEDVAEILRGRNRSGAPKKPTGRDGAVENEDENDNEDDDCDDEEIDHEKSLVDDDDDEETWEDLKQVVRPICRSHTPGLDSGCTVVVALINGGKLYVASAGDSRCIILMRNQLCKPMSFDHKPENVNEKRRIILAGGRVTDGRVNGGLNLSRALGDFSYKDPQLNQKDQMITPCPDVRVAELGPNVKYVFLACDGIWNSMRNKQVTRFINKTAKTVNDNLVDICVHLFRECIAPVTDGDGTGCDNMTCILARFDRVEEASPNRRGVQKDLKVERIDSEKSSDETPTANSQKRVTTSEDSEDMPKKRRCVRL